MEHLNEQRAVSGVEDRQKRPVDEQEAQPHVVVPRRPIGAKHKRRQQKSAPEVSLLIIMQEHNG